jgi:hypothetical protein
VVLAPVVLAAPVLASVSLATTMSVTVHLLRRAG